MHSVLLKLFIENTSIFNRIENKGLQSGGRWFSLATSCWSLACLALWGCVRSWLVDVVGRHSGHGRRARLASSSGERPHWHGGMWVSRHGGSGWCLVRDNAPVPLRRHAHRPRQVRTRLAPSMCFTTRRPGCFWARKMACSVTTARESCMSGNPMVISFNSTTRRPGCSSCAKWPIPL